MKKNKWSLITHHWSLREGFTLIELLIVFSVIAIISSVGIASYQKYSDAQKLRSATLGLKTVLQQARSQALSQVIPPDPPYPACGTFQGYEVRICCVPSGSSCPTCLSSGNYELDAICSSSPNGILISSTTFASGISVDVNTSWRSFRFIPITGGIVKGGTIVLDGKTTFQTIIVSGAGIIQ